MRRGMWVLAMRLLVLWRILHDDEGLGKTSGECPEKVSSHSRRTRVIPGFGGRDDRHARSVRVTIYQSESPIKGTRRESLGAPEDSERDKNWDEILVVCSILFGRRAKSISLLARAEEELVTSRSWRGCTVIRRTGVASLQPPGITSARVQEHAVTGFEGWGKWNKQC